ncbi:hypothetical protein B0H14DRAFT_3633262 [Mycena olivaceomarginata]|nr:hypothetical protein B0H14DRAFT_3633262 [Mycena olivaceomarginata]
MSGIMRMYLRPNHHHPAFVSAAVLAALVDAVCTMFQPSQTDAALALHMAWRRFQYATPRDANLRKAATKADELVRSKYIKVVHRTVMTIVIILNSQTTVGSHTYLSPLFIEL